MVWWCFGNAPAHVLKRRWAWCWSTKLPCLPYYPDILINLFFEQLLSLTQLSTRYWQHLPSFWIPLLILSSTFIMDSEPLTSGSYHAHCATDNEELTYLKRIHILRWVRFGLAFIILGAAVAIIGCEAGPLRHYHRTSEYEKVWLYLWPLNFDIRPTIAPLSCGCVIACLNLVYVVVALLPLVSWSCQPSYVYYISC